MNIANKKQQAIALVVAINILDKWGCSNDVSQLVLGISDPVYSRIKQELLDTITLNREQLERVALVASIHASLRLLFHNPENVYGFMAMENNDEIFKGKSPLDIISTGELVDLQSVQAHVDGMKGGLW